jgi:hypothetical protein
VGGTISVEPVAKPAICAGFFSCFHNLYCDQTTEKYHPSYISINFYYNKIFIQRDSHTPNKSFLIEAQGLSRLEDNPESHTRVMQ